MESKVLDHGYCKLIPRGTWGEDSSIIEAARMSTDKGFVGWGPKHAEECETHCSIAASHYPETPGCICTPKAGDEKLLRYLWEHKHHTPFEMAGATFEVQAPIFVFREWHRHRTQSYNELSGRYSVLPEMFYIPSIERLKNGKQSAKNKQGSEEGFSEREANDFQIAILESSYAARATYDRLLKAGVAKEIARMVIPVNQYSRMRASANLRNWLGFLTLRIAEGVQWETRQYAEAIHLMLKEQFPRTLALFDEGLETQKPQLS